jgi:hypothetical protein
MVDDANAVEHGKGLKWEPVRRSGTDSNGGHRFAVSRIVLAATSGLLVYVAVQKRKETDLPLFSISDGTERVLVGLSALAFLVAPAWDAWSIFNHTTPSSGATASQATADAATSGQNAEPSAEELSYINQNLKLYDLKAKYFDSFGEGRVPGVEFKIKNDGNRTITSMTVKVVFYDASDKPIAEEEYHPVQKGGLKRPGFSGGSYL